MRSTVYSASALLKLLHGYRTGILLYVGHLTTKYYCNISSPGNPSRGPAKVWLVIPDHDPGLRKISDVTVVPYSRSQEKGY